MFFRDKLSNILRSVPASASGGGGSSAPAPAPASGAGPAPAAAQASNGSNASSNSQEETETNRMHIYKPDSVEIRNYKAMNVELNAEIEKQRKRKKNALIFLGIGIVCTVMLGVGLFTPYGPQGFTAMESLQGAKGGALGLETAQLAFGFSTVGFLIPIAMTVISLMAGLVSNNKIYELKKQKAFNNQLLSGVSSPDKNISRDKVVQHDAAVLMVEERGQSWKSRVRSAEESKDSWECRVKNGENRRGSYNNRDQF